jgi:hypothetical protein
MSATSDFTARGKVSSADAGVVVFHPANTTYQMHLGISGGYSGPLNKPISATVRVTAAKVYTVPSGGNFIAPIYGPPRIIQGRVVRVDDKSMVVHAGLPILVELPAADSAIDLDNGQIAVGTMVNVVALPGAKFSLAEPANHPVAQTAH